MRIPRAVRADPYPITFATVAGFIILVSTLLVRDVPPRLAERIITEQKTQEAVLWKRGAFALLDEGTDSFIAARLPGAATERLADSLLISQAEAMSFYDRIGRPFWSSAAYDSSGFLTETERARINAGNPVTHLRRRAGSSAGAPARVVADILTPVRNDAAFAGAIRFTSDVTELFTSTVDKLRMALALISLAGGTITLGGLATILRGQRQRMSLLRARSERDAESMAEQVRIAREVQLLGELNEWMHSATTLDDLFRMVSRYMSHLMPVSEGAIYVYSASRDVLDGWAAWNGAALHDHIHPDECWALRRGRTYAYGTGEISFACDHVETAAPRPYFCFPILAHGETVGLMHIRAGPGEPASAFREGRRIAQICAEQVAMAIANVQMRDQLREQATRDPLTGLFNRRYMQDRLRTLMTRARATDMPISVAMIDVDHFKKFNDNHGHDAGDMVLRAVAGRVAATASGDEALACRFGGEEFTLVLPGISAAEAGTHVDQLRAAIAEDRIVYEGGKLPAVTISAGVADFPAQGTLIQELLRVADEALYRAKGEGRDRVIIAGAPDAAGGGGAPKTAGEEARAPAVAGAAMPSDGAQPHMIPPHAAE